MEWNTDSGTWNLPGNVPLFVLTFFLFVRETFLILLNLKDGFCFAITFHWSLLIHHPVSRSVLHRQSFRPYCAHDPSHCLHFKVLPPVSLLKYFRFITYVTQWLAIRSIFVAIFRRKYRKKVAEILVAPLCFPKSKSISLFVLNQFDFGSNLIIREKFSTALKISLFYLAANMIQICIESARLSPCHVLNQPLHRLSWFWNILFVSSNNWTLLFIQKKGSIFKN